MIFDKSVLQALSLDEAVWLDNFYLADITRLFLLETPTGRRRRRGRRRHCRHGDSLTFLARLRTT
jgi:hypothetical protein